MMLLFFFKQKTAYEMRISDWSSDVCSSDLDLVAAQGGRLLHLDVTLICERPKIGPHRDAMVVEQFGDARQREGDHHRSEERRVGKEGVSTCRFRRWTYP